MGRKRKSSFSECVAKSLKRYFKDMKGEDPRDLHAKVVSEVERHLLEYVLNHTKGNRTRTARVLGLSRSTLRKKIALHEIKEDYYSDNSSQ